MTQPKSDAQTGSPAGRAEALSTYLTFTLGAEVFALGIGTVKEIIEFAGLTLVPLMPECIRGVMNLRGAVVPVLDLSVRFGRGPTEIRRRTCVIIVEVGAQQERQQIGVLVDSVNQVLDIAPTEIEPPPTFGAKLRPDFISGLGKVSEQFVILLDLARVLSLDEIARLVRATEESQTTSDESGAHV